MTPPVPGERGILAGSMPRPTTFAFLLALALAASARAEAPSGESELRFLRDGQTVRTISAETLAAGCGAQTITVEDPYYGKTKRFRACPLAAVLRMGFGEDATALAGEDFFFRAKDGYTRPAVGRVLSEPGGYVAFGDADLGPGRFEPIDRRQLDPGPFYLVWTGASQRDPHRHPWPYQLVTVEIAPFEKEFPHTIPIGVAADSAAFRGFDLFKSQCLACHAVNGEGGTVGPELNVPRSIVEYRPREQIRAYVKDPGSFRYTTMPPHPDLSEADLDALIAYFEAMRDRKHDPRKAPPP